MFGLPEFRIPKRLPKLPVLDSLAAVFLDRDAGDRRLAQAMFEAEVARSREILNGLQNVGRPFEVQPGSKVVSGSSPDDGRGILPP